MPDSKPAPGLIFFMLDQLSAKWLEGEARSVVPTPHLDRLQAEGTTFRRAFTSNPVCMPARASLATGLSSRGHGVLQNTYALNPQLPTCYRLLQESGWRTGLFGKLHLHPHFQGVRPDYSPYGFDVTHCTEDPRLGSWLDWVEAEHPQWLEAALSTVWAQQLPELAADGPQRRDRRSAVQRARQAANWSSREVPQGTPTAYALPFPAEVSQTEWITAGAEAFIQAQPTDKPFFAQISYVQPHGPWSAPKEYFDRVDRAAIPAPLPATWEQDPNCPAVFQEMSRPDRSAWQDHRACYFADIAHLDAQLGRVIQRLTETGRLETTTIILLADHGELLLDHGFRGKENRHYDACTRIPLIIRLPQPRQTASVDAFVQLEDLFPTVLELAGLPIPKAPVAGTLCRETPTATCGRSLLPWCRGERPPHWRDQVYIESYNGLPNTSPRHWARSIRTDQHRYTLYPIGGGEQLFDLQEDPDELINRIGDPNYAAVRTALRDRLLEAVILQDDPHPPRDFVAHGIH